ALGSDLRAVTAAIGAARRGQSARRRAGAIAFLFHVAAVPVAAAGLLNPLTAVGIGMACGLVMIGIGLRAGGS
ncbi:MAG: hypothetical protein HUU15_19220, partial [Candidatus Brocadiae bacterium]|nr:hypothetical protein [Candidatus Brocadiia bacterium]